MIRIHRIMIMAAAAVISLALLQAPARAATVLSFVETVGGDVVGTVSGGFNLTGLLPSNPSGSTTTGSSGVQFGTDRVNILTLGYSGPFQRYDFVSGPAVPGSPVANSLLTTPVTAHSITGPFMRFFSKYDPSPVTSFIYLTGGYSSGDSLAGTITFFNTTLASLNMNPGNYVYTLANQDTFTLDIGPALAPVPLPAAMPLFLGGLGLLGLFGWRRKSRAAA